MIRLRQQSIVFGLVCPPVLRIPLKGGAVAMDVRTTWEAGRGRSDADVSKDDEYPGSSVGP